MCAGLRLDDAGTEALSWADLLAFCKWSPPDSALFAAINPDHVPLDTALLVSIEFSLRWLKWAKTDDAKRGRNMPEPIEVGSKPQPDYTSMTVDEMDAFLGRSFRN